MTVTAEATPLQTDVAVRKTVEAKDIELLSFSGRNPIGVPALKAGVIGGSFNNAGFSSLTTGGFNINGSRSDENTIYVDGADRGPHALDRRDRRRAERRCRPGSPGAHRELHARIRPRERRPDPLHHQGGQQPLLRQRVVLLPRRQAAGQHLGAQPQPQRDSRTPGPSPFDYKQYGYAFGGPIPGGMFKDKAFFFAAQEWVNFFQVQTNTATVPTATMRAGDFSELFESGQRLLQHGKDHQRSDDRPAVPRQHHSCRVGCRRMASRS